MLPRSTCCQSPFVRGASLYTKRWSRLHTLERGKKFPKIAKASTWNHNRRVELHSHRSWCRCLPDRISLKSTSTHLTHSYGCGRKRWNLNSRSIQSLKRKEALHKKFLSFWESLTSSNFVDMVVNFTSFESGGFIFATFKESTQLSKWVLLQLNEVRCNFVHITDPLHLIVQVVGNIADELWETLGAVSQRIMNLVEWVSNGLFDHFDHLDITVVATVHE